MGGCRNLRYFEKTWSGNRDAPADRASWPEGVANFAVAAVAAGKDFEFFGSHLRKLQNYSELPLDQSCFKGTERINCFDLLPFFEPLVPLSQVY